MWVTGPGAPTDGRTTTVRLVLQPCLVWRWFSSRVVASSFVVADACSVLCLSSPSGPVQDVGDRREKTCGEVCGQAAGLGQVQRDKVLFTGF